jgi:DNA-binding response OmpR family regulator
MVLDVNLPRMSGLALLEQVRSASDLPVIMLTVRDAEEEVVRAFELGADDYVTKPFSPRQLVARVKAALRRSGAGDVERAEITVGNVKLDLARHEFAVLGREPVHLTQLEMRLLQVLMSAPDEPFTAGRLIERVWGYEGSLADLSLLKSLVRRVRLKVEPDPRQRASRAMSKRCPAPATCSAASKAQASNDHRLVRNHAPSGLASSPCGWLPSPPSSRKVVSSSRPLPRRTSAR